MISIMRTQQQQQDYDASRTPPPHPLHEGLI